MIPTHCETLSEPQRAAFDQVLTVLGSHEIHLAVPETFDAKAFSELAPTVRVRRFDDRWFASFAAHQRLMISPIFYEAFSAFTHILIYHLDAYVFRDELLEWCQAGYDYIGAPWRTGTTADGRPLLESAGNGGFSLRNVSSALTTLRLFNHRRFRRPTELWQELAAHQGLQRLKSLAAYPFKCAGVRNTLAHYLATFPYTEDKFWSRCATLANPSFRVAPPDIAKDFAFETCPDFLYEQRREQLPFGCHAWRYHQEFWCGVIGLPPDREFADHLERLASTT